MSAANMRDLHGKTLGVGTRAKLSGGYADRKVPTYLVHEEVEVMDFARTRVMVRLLRPDYASRPYLAVLPKTLVVIEDEHPKTGVVMSSELGDDWRPSAHLGTDEDMVPCAGALTCERLHSGRGGHPGWHSRLMPNGTFIEWTDNGKIRVTEDTGEEVDG